MTQTGLVIIVRFRIVAEHVDAFMAKMLEQARNSLDREEACRRFDICVDPADARNILLYEIYDDAAAFDVHLASEHFRTFDAEVAPWVEEKIVERWAGPPA